MGMSGLLRCCWAKVRVFFPRATLGRPVSDGREYAFKTALQSRGELCDNYVMRSTRHVVSAKESEGLGHYSDPPLLVLASLASGPKHGHLMIEDIESLCGTRLGPGTLYGAIGRLERQGWIEPLPAEERRQPYRITAEGLNVLRAKLTKLRRFAKSGLKRLEVL
jgi:DNA-binding MarR family transcriptional regulator